MLGDDEQQPIPGADPAGGIAVEEAIRDRAVRQRDESNARTTNANMARKTAMGKLRPFRALPEGVQSTQRGLCGTERGL